MNSICADTFNFQGMMQTAQRLERKPNPIVGCLIGALLYRHLYTNRRKVAQLAVTLRQAPQHEYADHIGDISTFLAESKKINSILNSLSVPMFVQRMALDIEHELSDLLEDLYIASDPEIHELSQELETLLS
ncbi:MAG: hypothetical protein R3Y11_08160 [Pseudomonadota bacterium]